MMPLFVRTYSKGCLEKLEELLKLGTHPALGGNAGQTMETDSFTHHHRY